LNSNTLPRPRHPAEPHFWESRLRKHHNTATADWRKNQFPTTAQSHLNIEEGQASPVLESYLEAGFAKGATSLVPQNWARKGSGLTPCEKNPQRLKTIGLVKGHDFSRADKAVKIKRALAPAKVGLQEIASEETCSAACLTPAPSSSRNSPYRFSKSIGSVKSVTRICLASEGCCRRIARNISQATRR